MIYFYDSSGTAIAFSNDDRNVFLYDGTPVANIQGNAVYTYTGTFLGWFEEGWLIDVYGRYAFFTDEVTGGPVPPIPQVAPVPPVPPVLPIQAVGPVAPVRPLPGLIWSDLTVEEYFDLS